MLKVKNNNSPRLYESRAGCIIHRIQRLFQALRPLNESCNGSLETLKSFIMVNVRAYKAATYLPTVITICPFSLYISKWKKSLTYRWVIMIAEFLKSMARRSSDWWGMEGAFFLPWFGSPLGDSWRWVTANQYIVILIDHLCPTMSHLFVFLCWSPWSLPGWQCLHP